MTLYVITFKTYGSEEFQVSTNAHDTLQKANKEAKILRANGHKDVKVIRVMYNNTK